MKLQNVINKIEKAFGEKINFKDGQYYIYELSFYAKNDIVNFITVSGSHCTTIKQALKKFGK